LPGFKCDGGLLRYAEPQKNFRKYIPASVSPAAVATDELLAADIDAGFLELGVMGARAPPLRGKKKGNYTPVAKRKPP
jgi:hypothetical protein